MSVPVEVEESLAVIKFAALFPHLDERQRRLLTRAEARVLGHGGVAAVAPAAGVGASPPSSTGASTPKASRSRTAKWQIWKASTCDVTQAQGGHL